MNLLVVAAPPDDDVLGAGATMYKLSKDGAKVAVCILSGAAEARYLRPSVDVLTSDIDSTSSMLGYSNRY